VTEDTACVIELTVKDLKTGETQMARLPAGTYVVTTTEPCHVAQEQHYPRTGTVQLTLKGARS
jgi:hypothetical protein